jgi:hypothetical protein
LNAKLVADANQTITNLNAPTATARPGLIPISSRENYMKTKLRTLMIYAAFMMSCGNAFADNWTLLDTYLIQEVFVTSDYYYVYPTAGVFTISGTTCTTPQSYLLVNRVNPNARELLSVILTAKASGRKVSAYGTCGSGANNPFFNTNYIVMH